MTFAHGEDPHGGESEIDPPEQVMGIQAPPMTIGESTLVANSKMNFNGEVARVFEEMVIPAQIPGYKQMRYRLLHAAMKFLKGDSMMADLGTSNGRMIRDIVAACAADNDPRLATVHYLGVDFEQDMLDQAEVLIGELRDNEAVIAAADKYRLKTVLNGHDRIPHIQMMQHDLRHGVPSQVHGCSLITSILTLQFVPIEHRPRILRQIYNSLNPGGAFLYVEKILAPSVDIDDFLSEMYYQDKARNGIGNNDIVNKRRSLEGHLMPMTHKAHMDLLIAAGFREHSIDVFWRDLQFEAIIAIKG